MNHFYEFSSKKGNFALQFFQTPAQNCPSSRPLYSHFPPPLPPIPHPLPLIPHSLSPYPRPPVHPLYNTYVYLGYVDSDRSLHRSPASMFSSSSAICISAESIFSSQTRHDSLKLICHTLIWMIDTLCPLSNSRFINPHVFCLIYNSKYH